MRAEYLGLGIFAIYIFAVSNTISNAMVSISSALILLYILYDYFKNKRSFPTMPGTIKITWGIFLGTLLLASLFLGDVPSIKCALDYVYLSLPFLILFCFYYYHPQQKLFLYSIAASFLLMGGKSLYVYLIVNHMSSKRVLAFDSGPNPFAAILITSLPFLCLLAVKYYRANKITGSFLLFSSIAGLIGLILTASRGAQGGFIAGLIFLTVMRQIFVDSSRSIKLCLTSIALAVVLAFAFFNFQGNWQRQTDAQRPLFYKSSYAMWSDHKLIGVGLTNWEKFYYSQYRLPEAFEKNISMPHNSIAFYFSTTGLLGGLGFVIFTVGILAYLLRKMRTQPDNYLIPAMIWSFFAITAHGMVDTGIAMRIVFRLFATYMGITIASILLYERAKLKILREQKSRTTSEQYSRQRCYGFCISHKKNDKGGFR